MLLVVHIVISIVSLITAITVHLKRSPVTNAFSKPSLIISTTTGSIVTGLILVTQGSSIIRVCALGVALSTLAIFSIIKSVKNNQFVIDL